LSVRMEPLERVKFRLRSGASSQVYIADVSGTVRDAHKLRVTGGDAPRGKDDAQWLIVESSLMVAGTVIISCPKIPLENIAFNPSDFRRMKPKDMTLKRMDK
jgi:hypothetical protein